MVLPLADTKEVPAEPPLELPSLSNICQLGTRACGDCVELEKVLNSEGRDFRMKLLQERERLGIMGFEINYLKCNKHYGLLNDLGHRDLRSRSCLSIKLMMTMHCSGAREM